MKSVAADHTLRRAVRLVAVLNLTYFGIEFAVARAIGSVSLFADSIDFLEDASINFGELGFGGVDPKATGRPSYHPTALLKLYIYGYLNRVQSSRRLERNVEVMV